MKFRIEKISGYGSWDDAGPAFDTCKEAVEWIIENQEKFDPKKAYGNNVMKNASYVTEYYTLMIRPIEE